MAIITEAVGDIFSAPPNSILIHACNARGAWGSGVALSFKRAHPHAFHKYKAHCLSPPPGSKKSPKQHQASIVGTTLLIPPPDATKKPGQGTKKTSHHIACLFTSLDYGKRVSPAEEILKNTKDALKDLATQLTAKRGAGEEVGKCYAVRINSGKFGVEWQKTKAVLEAGELDIAVLRPGEEQGADGAGAESVQSSVEGVGAKGGASSKATRAKAGSTSDGKLVGEKRKRQAYADEDGHGVRDNVKGKQSTLRDMGVVKRKKLDSDDWPPISKG